MTEKLETIINREIDKIMNKDDIEIEDLKLLSEILTTLEMRERFKVIDEGFDVSFITSEKGE